MLRPELRLCVDRVRLPAQQVARLALEHLAVLKNGRAKAVRFTTLDALCEVLECQPGDLLRWEADAVDA